MAEAHHLMFRKGRTVGEMLGFDIFLGPVFTKGWTGPIKCHYLEFEKKRRP